MNANRYRLDALRAGFAPWRVHFAATLRSTNDHAASLRAKQALFAPAVVVCARQTRGRGRGGNGWLSVAGCLTATFVFPIEEHLQPHQLPLIAGLAVRDAAAALSGVPDIQLKWPNDVLHEGRKLAGLLCERIGRVDLIGIGLNVNADPADFPAGLRPGITSLRQLGGREIPITEALLAVGDQLRRRLGERDAQPFAEFLREYDAHHCLNGRQLSVLPGPNEPVLTGRCQGLDPQGRLLLRDSHTLHRIIAGHVLVR